LVLWTEEEDNVVDVKTKQKFLLSFAFRERIDGDNGRNYEKYKAFISIT
jgi:hypothetical protein